MDNKEFKKIIQDCISHYGFIYQNKNYYHVTKDLIVVINFQKSNYENAYYINYGFWVKQIHEETKYPSVEMCDVMGRFNNLMGEKMEHSFGLDTLNEDELTENIKRNISTLIIPVIENGVEKYFEMFPKAIYAAKISLRSYLNNETI